jgi:lipopolysaccharide/colanic/teichoic acid biosynthesis glycosyltransferase
MRVEGFSLSPRLAAELPLVFNVARGHALPAGPRPSPRYEAARYNPGHRRASVTDGVIGLRQVHGRSAVSVGRI